MIEVQGVSKRYGSVEALRDVSLTASKGRVLGLLGQNGAGKTTLLNIITGYLAPTAGRVLIDGHDPLMQPEAAKRDLGYLPEQPPLYDEMTVEEYLYFVAALKQLQGKAIPAHVKEIMTKTGLTEMRERMLGHLSKGYRQRVGVAQALCGDPDVLVLDEPTVGLDPKQLIEIRELIRQLGRNRTVMLSSHIMQEISAVCDTLIIISNGKLVAEDTPDNLEHIAEHEQTLELTVRCGVKKAKELIGSLDETVEFRSVKSTGDMETELEISVPNGEDVREKLFYIFANAQYAILSMVRKKQSLEDVFLSLTGNDAPVKTESAAKEGGAA
jgi:ABC-2 type transport system ATP-binding protein